MTTINHHEIEAPAVPVTQVTIEPLDQPVPTSDNREYLLAPQSGLTTREMFEIQTAVIFRLLSVPIPQKGFLNNIKLSGDYVEMLSDNTQKHFRLKDQPNDG